jgi:hypothetical protein
MPMIVVGNACQSGHTTAWDGDTTQVFGLANAFLTAGVRHYVGTQWEVVDGQSALFAAELYRHLTDGKAIGAAVRHARAAVVERAGETALAWASYVLYGDPEVRPLHRPEAKQKLSIPSGLKIAARASAPWKRPAQTGARALPGDKGDAIDRVERRVPAWLAAALGGVAAGLVGVLVAAWLMHRKPAPPKGRPTLSGIAVLAISAGDSPDDQARTRDLEGCLPMQLTDDHAAVVAPEKLMTLEAQTNGVYDKASARALGLAVGARWVVYGNVVAGTANLFVATVLDDRTVYADSFKLDDVKARCTSFAAAVAARLATEAPPQP